MKLDACVNGLIGTSMVLCSIGGLKVVKTLDLSRCGYWNLNMGFSTTILAGTLIFIREFLR